MKSMFMLVACWLAGSIMATEGALTIDWTNTGITQIGTNFTLHIGIDAYGDFSLVSTENIPPTMQFSATGTTSLLALSNKTFSLTFSSVNGQAFVSHSSAGAYRIGMQGGANAYRFDDPGEVARVAADLSQLGASETFRLKSFQSLNSVTNFVIGLRDSSGMETTGATNQTNLADVAPLLA